MPLIYFSGSNSRTVSSLGDANFNVNAFNQWTYVDHMHKYVIKYSTDGVEWKTYGDVISQDKNFKANDFVFENVKARYLVVEAADSANYWIKISDFMVETFDIVDKSLLIETIDAANDLDREGKTPESIEKLEEAIDKAQAVIDKDD